MSWASSSATRPAGPRGASASTGRKALHGVGTAVLGALTYVLVGVPAYFAAGASGSVTTYAVLQSVVGLVVLVAVVRWRAVAGLRAGVPVLPWTGVGAAAGYLLIPAAWTGSALFWWRLVDPGALTFALDLPV